MSSSSRIACSQLSNYRQTCDQIIGRRRLRTISGSKAWNHSLQKSRECSQRVPENERLSYKDIQKITRAMMGDKKSHDNNVGVLTNIKGKMYCLKLGEVSNFKEFSHYFYASQYRRKQTAAENVEKEEELQNTIKTQIRKRRYGVRDVKINDSSTKDRLQRML